MPPDRTLRKALHGSTAHVANVCTENFMATRPLQVGSKSPVTCALYGTRDGRELLRRMARLVE